VSKGRIVAFALLFLQVLPALPARAQEASDAQAVKDLLKKKGDPLFTKQRKFQPEKWKKDPQTPKWDTHNRPSMMIDLVSNHQIIGLTYKQVHDMFGPPALGEPGVSALYEVWDWFSKLVEFQLSFKDGRVEKWRVLSRCVGPCGIINGSPVPSGKLSMELQEFHDWSNSRILTEEDADYADAFYKQQERPLKRVEALSQGIALWQSPPAPSRSQNEQDANETGAGVQKQKWRYGQRGSIYASLKRFPEALADYDKAIELGHGDFYGWYLEKGRVLYELKRYDECIAAYNEIIDRKRPAVFGAAMGHYLVERGEAKAMVGRIDDALADFRKAQSSAPDSDRPYRAMATLYEKQGDLRAARKVCDEGIAKLTAIKRAIVAEHDSNTHPKKAITDAIDRLLSHRSKLPIGVEQGPTSGARSGFTTGPLSTYCDMVKDALRTDWKDDPLLHEPVSVSFAIDSNGKISTPAWTSDSSMQARDLVKRRLDNIDWLNPPPAGAAAPFKIIALFANQSEKMTVQADNIDWAPYMADVQRRVRSKWNPPHGMKTSQKEVSFKIARDGHIFDVKLDSQSGAEADDKSALAAVNAANPLPPLPDGAPESVKVIFTLEYKSPRKPASPLDRLPKGQET